MIYGPITARKKMPKQDFELILLIANRFDRASFTQATWAAKAKECVEFAEGKQWSEEDIKKLIEQERPALTFNKIAPLLRLVMGFHRNNRTDERFLPSHDEASTEEIAEMLSKVSKQISEVSHQPFVATEVFADGIMTGRGYYHWKLDFTDNDLGEATCKAADPFAVYLDPDGDQYDLNKSSYVFESRWVSLDDVLIHYGKQAHDLAEPLLTGGAYTGLPSSLTDYAEEITPWRRFGGEEDQYATFGPMQGFLHNIIDTQRKAVRLLEMQHYRWSKTRVVIDLDTGQKKIIPDQWKIDKVQRFLAWQEDKYAALGQTSPIRYDERLERRCRWTTIIGDFIVWDDWSPYQTFTLIPFFPYFRRGKTRGMVEDLIDPQKEVNKRRSSQIDQVTRTAHAGWIVHKGGLDDEEKANWADNAAAPGFTGFWSGDEPWKKPEQITQGKAPIAAERLEIRATDDLEQISGINRALLGSEDKVQSGRALEAKQRQGVLSIQTYMDNMVRTSELVGLKKLELIQNHYTERRLIRTVAEDGSLEAVIINQRGVAGEVLNNITIGKYSLVIDETPLSASFLNAQFEDLMDMIEKGGLPVELAMDVLVETSHVPQKEMLKRRIKAYMAAQGIYTGEDEGMVAPLGQQLVPQAAAGAAPAQPAQPPAQAAGRSLVSDSKGNVVNLGPRGVPAISR